MFGIGIKATKLESYARQRSIEAKQVVEWSSAEGSDLLQFRLRKSVINLMEYIYTRA
jgi:hypothetical protein